MVDLACNGGGVVAAGYPGRDRGHVAKPIFREAKTLSIAEGSKPKVPPLVGLDFASSDA
jgi:hypothetical protein